MTFGEILSDMRTSRRLRQQELGDAIGVSRTTISNYESNTHFPEVSKLIALADYFGVTVDFLLGRSSVSIDIGALTQRYATRVDGDETISVGETVQRILAMGDASRGELVRYVDLLWARETVKPPLDDENKGKRSKGVRKGE